jgi:hypothetical protein
LNRSKLFAMAALLAIGALHIASMPRSIWEYDESFFSAAVERYEPLLHHPPPPGYPVYIAFAKVVALVTPDPFRALVTTSMLAVVLGFLAFVAAFADLADLRTGVLAAVLLYTAPAVLISGTLPQSDSGGLALLGLALWACTRDRPALCGLFCALAIGWRLQLCIAVVPMFLAAVVMMMRTWRARFIAVGSFGVACLAWLVPLVMAAGGPLSYWHWLSGQAAYYAEHDANLSRSGHSAAHIALRFLAHPWGPKWLSLPLLAIAIGGAFVMRRNRRVIPLAAGTLTYLAFALATMDPADAVRYAIPTLPLIALLAATALCAFMANAPLIRDSNWGMAVVPVLLYAIGAVHYTFPVLHARATSLSPPAAAARWIAQHVPRNAVVLYDLTLAPHAGYLLRPWKTMRIDAGMAQYGGEPSVPIVLLADGERAGAGGVTFRWPDTDAYRKLTREHYGAVSVIPIAAAERFRVVEGVYAPERTRDGSAWRWVSAKGVIELPDLGAHRSVRIGFLTPPDYVFADNRIHVFAGGHETVVGIRRDATAEAVVPLETGVTRITIVPERSFVPATWPGGNNLDGRTISVMLTRVQQLGGPGDSPRSAAGSPPRR